jgi:hypothetical protein
LLICKNSTCWKLITSLKCPSKSPLTHLWWCSQIHHFPSNSNPTTQIISTPPFHRWHLWSPIASINLKILKCTLFFPEPLQSLYFMCSLSSDLMHYCFSLPTGTSNWSRSVGFTHYLLISHLKNTLWKHLPNIITKLKIWIISHVLLNHYTLLILTFK